MAHFKVHSTSETKKEDFQKDGFDYSGQVQYKDKARIGAGRGEGDRFSHYNTIVILEGAVPLVPWNQFVVVKWKVRGMDIRRVALILPFTWLFFICFYII